MNSKKHFAIFATLFLFILLALPSAFAQESSSVSIVSLLNYEPDPVQPGQVMDLSLQINPGFLQETDRRASLEIVEEFPFIIEDSQDLERAKSIPMTGFVQKLQFRIRIDENALDGITPLRVRFNLDGDQGVTEYTFDINIETFDAKLSVLKLKQIPERIAPGEKGKLIITLQNMDDNPLRNTDVTLDFTNSLDMTSNMNNMVTMQAMVNARLEDVSRKIASGESPLNGPSPMMTTGNMQNGNFEFSFGAFSPVGSSNQKYLGTIQAREIVDVEFEVMALPDALPNVYAIPIFINYNDEENNPFHVRADIPAMIDDEPNVFVDLKSTGLRTTDFASEVVFVVANRGQSELKYVTVELVEDESLTILTAPKSIYLGNLAPGESKEGTYTVLAENEDIVFPLSIEYRDSYNKERTLEKEIPFKIINKNYYRDLPYEMSIAWIILGLVFLILTIFFVRQMSKKKND